jgi:hypothetical protein
MEVLSNSDELRVRGWSSSLKASMAKRELLLRMMVEGVTMKECAKRLGCSYWSVARLTKDEDFMKRLKELNVKVFGELDEELKKKALATHEKIQEVSDDALNKLLDLMESADSEVVQMRCAQDLLDRNPDTSKTKKIEKTTKNLTLSAEFLHLVETSEREAGTIDG